MKFARNTIFSWLLLIASYSYISHLFQITFLRFKPIQTQSVRVSTKTNFVFFVRDIMRLQFCWNMYIYYMYITEWYFISRE